MVIQSPPPSLPLEKKGEEKSHPSVATVLTQHLPFITKILSRLPGGLQPVRGQDDRQGEQFEADCQSQA